MLQLPRRGGHTGLGGRSVRRGRLYRSDSLHRLRADRETFLDLGIRTVIDLRRSDEVDRDGRVPAYDGLVYRHLELAHRPWEETPYDGAGGLSDYLATRYLEMAETGAAGIAAALEVIADTDNAPAVVHCVAGKDRTGMVCALTLALLGVADADIAADYALSTAAGERYREWARGQSPDGELPPPFLASPAEAMAGFLTGLRARHGDVEGYVRSTGLPADRIAALRGHLLD
ncbi:tyrosine-protein phosphatase [Plantactinospora sp. KBS50]|uniref:tyrosine-protein phosphatase n=1 Tax=Plantactinospora sp. KBS50 TaxID=2024580 RepID=UPI000BAAD404|nr:tyrosine-protein phosphatase [Plantactinospora sp. KBS50]ASW53952.1 protein tyrosine phosphatase [Plantactinospora sp. KBS50]